MNKRGSSTPVILAVVFLIALVITLVWAFGVKSKYNNAVERINMAKAESVISGAATAQH